MADKERGIVKANSLEELAKEFSRRNCFTTGNVADILQVSQQEVVRACDGELLEGYKVPGSRHRRIRVKPLVESLRKNWKDFNEMYPQRLLLHLIEVLGLNPAHYKLNGLAGKGGLRFRVQEDLYSTGKAADFMGLSQQTVIRSVDNGILEGYRAPHTDFRKIPAGALVRYAKENKIPLHEGAKIATSPELITYLADLGDVKGDRRWVQENRVAYKTDGNQSVWYMSKGKVHEFSIRQSEDYGLYVKFFEVERGNPIIYLILLDKANRGPDGKFLSPDKYPERVTELLEKGGKLLDEYLCGDGAKKEKILEVFGSVDDRFKAVYFLELKKY